MKTHEIKLNINFCEDVLSGEKNFEIRKNDRGYQKGDHIKFIPVEMKGGVPLRRHSAIENKKYIITYVLSGWGLQPDFVAFGIKEM